MTLTVRIGSLDVADDPFAGITYDADAEAMDWRLREVQS